MFLQVIFIIIVALLLISINVKRGLLMVMLSDVKGLKSLTLKFYFNVIIYCS